MEPPKCFSLQYPLIQEMRKQGPAAPVDLFGCDKLSTEIATPSQRRFHILIALMLSSQTLDHITAAAFDRLCQWAPQGNPTPEWMQELDATALAECLKPVGFYRRKAQYLIEMAKWCCAHNSDIPQTLEELTLLKGVGPKMAHLAMQHAHHQQQGLGIDVHIHRLVVRLGWLKAEQAKTPDSVRQALEAWLPRSLWSDFNRVMVGFGQTRCSAVKPKCEDCLLNNGICPKIGVTKSKRNQKQMEMNENEYERSRKRKLNETEMNSESEAILSRRKTRNQLMKLKDIEDL